MQAFPKLVAAARGRHKDARHTASLREEKTKNENIHGVLRGTGNSMAENDSEDGSNDADDSGGQERGDKTSEVAAGAAAATGGGGRLDRVPPLLALLHVVRGVPPEALSQELDAVVPAVVQALGSDYAPLQIAALETFQVSDP